MNYEIREEIRLNESLQETIIKMSEGNPGGLNVLMQILKESISIEDGFVKILLLDDMNIRGSQIWIGYKNYCECDIKKFMDCITNHDQKMISKINDEGRKGNHKWLTVQAGASVVGRKTFK